MALNGISTSTYKADRQVSKLELAKAKREGRIITEGSGTWVASTTTDVSAPFYRERNSYDITELPTVYATNTNLTSQVIDNPNLGKLTLTPGFIRSGVSKVTYTGYHGGNVAFIDTATETANEVTTNFTIASIAANTTVLYVGYLLVDYTGIWSFTITSDDESYLWIGNNAVSGYTTGNSLATANYAGPGTGTISMIAGQYYPIRLLYGNGPAAGNLNLTYAHIGQTTTNDFTSKLFSPDVSLVYGRPWI